MIVYSECSPRCDPECCVVGTATVTGGVIGGSCGVAYGVGYLTAGQAIALGGGACIVGGISAGLALARLGNTYQ